jgi:hypothetical protein
MNENHELLEGLRALAAEGPRESPAYIEDRLRAQFRRRKRRRTLLTTWVPAFGFAAAAGIALLVWTHSSNGTESQKPKPAPVLAVVAQAVVSAAEDETDASFYPLPEAESLPAVENAMVVRVQLPVSSLQLMGVPVSEERADASVQADLLLGQDGLARAVRLAQ